MENERKEGEREERVRLARSVWRPAEHSFTQDPSRRATVCTLIRQKPLVESSGGVRREAPRTATGTVALLNPPSHRVAVSRSDFWKAFAVSEVGCGGLLQ